MKRFFLSLFISWMFFYLCGCSTARYISPEEASEINRDIYLEAGSKTYIYMKNEEVRKRQINKKGDDNIFLQDWKTSGDSLLLFYNYQNEQTANLLIKDSLIISQSQIRNMYYKKFNVNILMGAVLGVALITYLIFSILRDLYDPYPIYLLKQN
jgi:hypothetical protein